LYQRYKDLKSIGTLQASVLACDRALCGDHGAGFSWAMSAAQSLDALAPSSSTRSLAA
jgi:hypothetical protein